MTDRKVSAGVPVLLLDELLSLQPVLKSQLEFVVGDVGLAEFGTVSNELLDIIDTDLDLGLDEGLDLLIGEYGVLSLGSGLRSDWCGRRGMLDGLGSLRLGGDRLSSRGFRSDLLGSGWS